MSAGTSDLLFKVAQQNILSLEKYSALSGGDINQVYLLECQEGRFVVKLNHTNKFPGMFHAEQSGLQQLAEPGVIDIPKIIATGEIINQSYLLLEYKPEGKKSSKFWSDFGEQLARLHKCTSASFGLDSNNYIGSLPQYNDYRENAADFYLEMRFEPQLKMAIDNGFNLEIPETFFETIRNIIPQEAPSLIHGDLWSGNFLVNSEGAPCLIDPAVAFASREMDLAMMKLFGGFDQELFNVYNEVFPLEKGWQDRILLWQLYYLMVHLNIFGTPYKERVESIIKHYS
ncbi:fructosamine kinase family protein [Christiangramia aquimixticola]|uniref:fructosamine kinase family protein n=1 Tax=Christiangramia aquimixticola TaxID=1697558 RepID=UPI003AA91634